jgi:DNA-binding beta-propeller fold protein YncE
MSRPLPSRPALRSSRFRALYLLIAGLAAVMTLAQAPAASAGVGDLEFVSCFADEARFKCAAPGPDALHHASDVVVSPDGSRVYTLGSSTVAQFNRSPDGSLKFAGCVSSEGAVSGCVDPTHDSIFGGERIAISPDGQDLYVTSCSGNSVSHLRHTGNGSLDIVQCFADEGSPVSGCQVPLHPSLEGSIDVDVSPDGKDVYVASGVNIDSTYTHFSRGSGGELTYVNCISGEGEHKCTKVGHALNIGAPREMTISPDGSSVYVAAEALVRFDRDGSGNLTFVACTYGGVECKQNSERGPYEYPVGLAMSTTPARLYLVGSAETVSRVALGSMALEGCLTSSPYSSIRAFCGTLENEALEEAEAIAATADGKNLYAANPGPTDTITHLDGASGVTFSDCIADESLAGCGSISTGILDRVSAVAVSPDGKDAYTTAKEGDALARFNLRGTPVEGGGEEEGGGGKEEGGGGKQEGGGGPGGGGSTPAGPSGQPASGEACAAAQKALANATKRLKKAKHSLAQAKTPAQKSRGKKRVKSAKGALAKARAKLDSAC